MDIGRKIKRKIVVARGTGNGAKLHGGVPAWDVFVRYQGVVIADALLEYRQSRNAGPTEFSFCVLPNAIAGMNISCERVCIGE